MAGFACPSNLSDGNGTSSSAGHNIILVVVVDYSDEDIRDTSAVLEVSVLFGVDICFCAPFINLLRRVCESTERSERGRLGKRTVGENTVRKLKKIKNFPRACLAVQFSGSEEYQRTICESY